MKSLLSVLLGACCVSTAFAQLGSRSCGPDAPKTRAEVKAELAAWRAANYNPLDWFHYPENAIQAGRIVSEQRAHAGQYVCPR